MQLFIRYLRRSKQLYTIALSRITQLQLHLRPNPETPALHHGFTVTPRYTSSTVYTALHQLHGIVMIYTSFTALNRFSPAAWPASRLCTALRQHQDTSTSPPPSPFTSSACHPQFPHAGLPSLPPYVTFLPPHFSLHRHHNSPLTHRRWCESTPIVPNPPR